MAKYIECETAIAKLTALEVTEPIATMIDAKRLLAEMPAADVAPVAHSYWEHMISSDEENIDVCHNCKYPVSRFWGITKYCPNCGAKMDGKDEEA